MSQDPQYSYRGLAPECNLTIEQIMLSTRLRYSAPREIQERVDLMLAKNPDLNASGAGDFPITSFQEIYMPLPLIPFQCSDCEAAGSCLLLQQNPNPEVRELFPRYLIKPQVVVSVLLEGGELFTKTVLPPLCLATPEELYMVGALDIDIDSPEEESPYSQKRLMAGIIEPESNENRVIDERSQASNCKFELSEPLLACMGCTLTCPLKNQDGFELA